MIDSLKRVGQLFEVDRWPCGSSNSGGGECRDSNGEAHLDVEDGDDMTEGCMYESRSRQEIGLY